MKKFMIGLLAIILLIGAAACAPAATTDDSSAMATPEEAAAGDAADSEGITLGVSYAFTSVPVLQYHIELYEQYSEDRGWDLVFLDANSKPEQQVADIENMIQQEVDYMIVFPVDATAGLTAIQQVTEAGIPLVFFSYPVEGAVWGTDYLAIGTGDNELQGAEAANYVKANWEAKGFSGDVKYINLEGPVANLAATDRSAGFAQKAEEYGFVEVATQAANWSRSEAQQIVTNIIQSSDGDFNVIYSANEEMLLGAIAAMDQAGMDSSKVFTICIDATKEVCGMIQDGTIDGVVFYGHEDLVGGQFTVLDKYINGEEIENEITGLTLEVIDEGNVEEYLAGNGLGLIVN